MLRNSPVKRSRMMNPYCSCRGLSRWNFSRKIRFTSSETLGFNSPQGYGLPGVSVMMKNEIRLMKNKSTTEARRRRMIKTVMAYSLASSAYSGR